MTCQEVRELLEEYRRGELSADVAGLVAAHLADCAQCRALAEEGAAMAALVATLPRPPAPASLTRAVRRMAGAGRGGAVRAWVGRPWVAAAVAAAVVAIVLAPWTLGRLGRADDPVERVLRSGVAEHTRILLQLQAAATGQVADAAEAFATVRSLTDVQLPWVFAGDADLTLMEARPTMIADRKAAAVVLRDPAWFITTYFALPGRDLPPPPEKGRVQIEQYRPYMRQVEGFNVIYWKQGEYAYLMVSDLDTPRCQQLFLKMRKGI
jgi:anti-sigma factor RsiW